MKSNLIDIDVYVKRETEKAVCVNTGDMQQDTWLPLSQCELEYSREGEATLTLPEWLALDKGLI